MVVNGEDEVRATNVVVAAGCAATLSLLREAGAASRVPWAPLIREAGGVGGVVRLLDSEEPETLLYAAGAVQNLSSDRELCAQLVAEGSVTRGFRAAPSGSGPTHETYSFSRRSPKPSSVMRDGASWTAAVLGTMSILS